MKALKKTIPVAEPHFDHRELEFVTDCVKTGWISSIGPYVTEFEDKFSRFCDTSYGVACANGTVALHLALVAMNVRAGDEVICPALTFIASANAITYTGAKPVFVDAEPRTWNMDPAKVKAVLTPKTKAIMVVHLYGHPVEMGPILELAKSKGLPVIEDSAEAHGALYKGRKVGSLGELGCFSFYGNKIITTGEGGMIVSNNKELVEKMKLLRDHAMDPKRRYWHPLVGYNYRLTNLQAAVGVAQMEKIGKFLEIRKRNAKMYQNLLKGVEGITLFPEASWANPVYWMVSVLVEKEFGMNRDQLALALKEKGIDTRPFFIPLHEMPPYQGSGTFPFAEEISRKGMNLPSSTKLTSDDIEYICETIKEIKAG